MRKQVSELTAVDLVPLFKSVCGGNVVLGRDARLFRKFMDEEGVEPSQVLLGLYLSKNKSWSNPSIFLHAFEDWLERDQLIAEALLCSIMSAIKLPSCYWNYRDLWREDWLDARAISALTRGREELSEWVKNQLAGVQVQVGRGAF